MIIIWVIGSPTFAFYILYKNRNRLNEHKFQKYMIVLYQGLKDDKFYWELLNIVRKVAIVAINVFLSTFSAFYKGASGVILLVIFTRMQLLLNPFKNEMNNDLELSSYTGKLTYFNIYSCFGHIIFRTHVSV